MPTIKDLLPHGVVALEDALSDGRITRLEWRGVLALVDQENVFTAAQKRQVRTLVDDWFAQDEAGAT